MRRKQLLMEGKLPPPNSPAHLLPLSLLLKGSTIVSSPTFLTMFGGNRRKSVTWNHETPEEENTQKTLSISEGGVSQEPFLD